jgi:N-acyl-L-homoserine lactone synthetase
MERIIGLSGWEFNRVSDVVQIGKTQTVVGVLPVDRKFIEKISSKLVKG